MARDPRLAAASDADLAHELLWLRQWQVKVLAEMELRRAQRAAGQKVEQVPGDVASDQNQHDAQEQLDLSDIPF